MWFILLPVNKHQQLVEEGQLILIIFAAQMFFYSIFVKCTIAQICTKLDIHCLSIKHPKNLASPTAKVNSTNTSTKKTTKTS